MSWSCPFTIRPPEEHRHGPQDPNRPSRPVLVTLGLWISQTASRFWELFSNKARKQIETRTATLEERMADARKPNLTMEEVETLLNDSSPLVRMELVHNSTISGDTLERLKSDPDVTVSTIARRKQFELMLPL